MSLAIIGVVGTVASAGAAAYGAYSQNKARKDAARQTAQAGQGINFGQKPKAAEYKPVDFTGEQFNTIMGNIANRKNAAKLAMQTNQAIDSDTLARARKFIPGYEANMAQEGQNSTQLLKGRLPYDDVLDIAANRSGLSGALGVPGTGGPATLRDLGLSRLDAIKTGGSMLNNMVDIAERVNPVNRRMTPQDEYLKPFDRIQAAMQQNQLIQQSDQNKYNIAAGLSPTDQANAQLQLAGALGGIGPSAGSAASSALISSLGSSIGGYLTRSGTGGGGSLGGIGSGGYSLASDPGLYQSPSGSYLTRGTSSPSQSVLSYRPSGFYDPYSINAT